MVSSSDPIPCSRISIPPQEVEQVLGSTFGIKDFAFRLNQDGYPEALIFVDEESGLDVHDIQKSISGQLHGYCIPDLHCLKQPLSTYQGEFDFDLLKQEIARGLASGLSRQEELVRDIVANLVHVDSSKITADSDFFLLGGNSLLLGQLSYAIRRQAGVNVGIPALFQNSTIAGIASQIEELIDKDHSTVHGFASTKTSPFTSESTLYGLGDFEQIRSRDQKNPICMIIQAIPFLFFYPLKAALSCTSYSLVQTYLRLKVF